MFNLWTHLAPILDTKIAYFSLRFSNDFFIKCLNQKRNFASARGDILKVRGEHGRGIMQEESWRSDLEGGIMTRRHEEES